LKKKNLSSIILILLVLQIVNAQIDIPETNSEGVFPSLNSTSNEISPFSLTSKEFSLSNTEEKEGFGMFKTADTLTIGEKPKEELKFTTDNGFVSTVTNKAPKYFTKDKEPEEGIYKGQFFGNFNSDSDYIILRCRDHEFVDGDRVRIYLNGRVLIGGILLGGSFRAFDIDLDIGFNKIEIEALNQGSSGPNTAAIEVVDADGSLLFSNEWNLATGVKASFVITKNN